MSFSRTEHSGTGEAKKETVVINRDWVYNQACRLSHDIQIISDFFITFGYYYSVRNKSENSTCLTTT